MKWLPGLVVVLLAVALGGAAGCGGDDDSSGGDDEVVSYFEGVDEVMSPMYENLASIANGIDGRSFDSDEEEISANRQALQEFEAELESGISGLGDLSPPAEAADEHAGVVEALTVYAEVNASILNEIEGVETSAELQAVMDETGADASSAFAAYDEACGGLEDEGEKVIEGYDVYCPGDDEE